MIPPGERGRIENGALGGFCWACGSRPMVRVTGFAYRMKCHACGYECIHKHAEMPDERILERLGSGVVQHG